MKVSVAMAAFNGEKFIEEQLASILSQTRPVDEVIICDDRSSDRTAELAEDFIARKHLQDTWRVEVNTQNVGYASNFIGAVRKTSGDVVFFCRSGRHLASGTGCRDGAHFRKEPGDSASLFRI